MKIQSHFFYYENFSNFLYNNLTLGDTMLEDVTTEQMLRDLVMDMMAKGMDNNQFFLLTNYLQAIGEMELLVEITMLRRKDMLSSSLEAL